jgi:hypothetical protein
MKSITFMMLVFLGGLSVIACKDAKPTEAETTTGSEMGVITSDSLKAVRETLTQSISTITSLIDQQISATETGLATADEAGKEILTRTLEQLKKVKANLEASAAKAGAATDATWAAMYAEIEPSLIEAKSILREGLSNPTASKKISVSPEGNASDLKK